MQNLTRRSCRYISRLLLLVPCGILTVGNLTAAPENVEKVSDGLLIKVGAFQVELAVINPGTFVNPGTLCLSVASGHPPQRAASSFLAAADSTSQTAWTVINKDGLVGVGTQAGKLLMDPHTGEWTLEDGRGKVLIPKCALFDMAVKSAATNSEIALSMGWNPGQPVNVYGCGNGVDMLQQTKAKTGLGNGRAVLPYYWSAAGYAVLAVTADDNKPAYWAAATNTDAIVWTFPGTSADLYLMPGSTLKAAASAYADLTGHAPVPPRWTFGYLQSKWGWTNRAYIEDALKHFQDLKLPVDAFIYDFEWFTAKPDYELPPEGVAGYSDFGWNPVLFPEPAKQVQDYKNQGVHFVGIRKPRLGNLDTLTMVRSKGWDLHGSGSEKDQARDMDFSNPAYRDWYNRQSAGLLQAGVDGWWNDEGEGSFTTYYYWNLAEAEALSRYEPGQRLWTLNRSFSPGVQRLGAAVWTGDIHTSWKVLAQTPVSLLNWSLAGMPYSACDIGGFKKGVLTPELFARWMEAGVFFPIMRAHSQHNVSAHFPWLYGTDALNAIRDALNLRYRLIPFYYSLAHETFETGVPLMRPLVMEFPDDPKVANLSDEWMMGDSILAAPILQSGGKRSVYLPTGKWYVFNTNSTIEGNRTLEVAAGLDEIPIYVRCGSLLPLGPVIQHTSELPGGPLELQIYPGRDASFTLVEDDGETTSYQKGLARRTVFTWKDSTRSLSWECAGDYAGKDCFQAVRAVLFASDGKVEIESELKTSGLLHLP